MSRHDEPSDASPGPDDNADNVFPTETEEKTTSTPEKDQFVYPDANLVQHTVSGLETSRKHGPPQSELSTEIASNGNAQQFYSNVDSKLHSKSLVNLQSPPDALQEGGRKRSMNLPLRKVVSLGSGEPRRARRTRSEGTTPPNAKMEELIVENQELKESLEKEQSANKLLEKERNVKLQASNDESISPLQVQQLKDHIITLEKKLDVLSDKHRKQKSLIQSLEQNKRRESEEKEKFEALYADEKRKVEEIEKKTVQSRMKITMLKQVVYRMHQVVKGLDEEADQVVPDPSEDLSADLDGQSLFSEGDVVLPISQDTCTGSSIQILYRHLQSLVCTGKGEKKVCNVCFKEKPIDSHIISKRVLDKAYEDRECRSIMLVDSQRPLTISTPSAWVEKLECGQCDRSTSRLEGAFVTRFHTYAPNIELHRQDALLFLLYGYRVLSMRKTFQYSVKDKLASYEELEAFMVQVWNIRRALLHGTEIDFSATNRVLFHVLTKRETKKSSYQIALVPCCVDLTAADPGHPDLKCCPLIYTKVRHCCWAVLLGDHTAADLQRHFWRMIDCIDCQLSQEKIEPQGIVRKNILRIEV